MKYSTHMLVRYNLEYQEFYIEVMLNPDGTKVDFTLCKNDIPTKLGIYGIPIEELPQSSWGEIIENNLEDIMNNYIPTFKERFL